MEQKKLEEAHKIATSSNPLLKGSTYGDKAMEYVGTIIECIEKQMPKKMKVIGDGLCECPDCKSRTFFIRVPKYCGECGQRLE